MHEHRQCQKRWTLFGQDFQIITYNNCRFKQMRTPWQLIGFIILIVSVASESEIRYVGELPTYSQTIFELEYKAIYDAFKMFLPVSELAASVISPLASGRDDSNSKLSTDIPDHQMLSASNKGNSSKKTGISQYLFDTLKQIQKKIENAKTEYLKDATIFSQFFTSQRCRTIDFQFGQQIKQITRVNFSGSYLLPGQLIQLEDPTNFAKGVSLYKSSDYTRKMMTVKLSKGLTSNRSLLVNPANSNLQEQIVSAISNNLDFLNSQPIKLYIQTPSRLQTVLRRLGLSSNIYELLHLANRYKFSSHVENKIVIILHQSLFSATVDLKSAAAQSSPTFFDSIFDGYSENMLQEMKARMDRDESVPLLVTQANYGRLLIMTLREDIDSQKLVRSLVKCFTGDRLVDSDGFALAMKGIAEFQPRFYYGGVKNKNNQLHIRRQKNVVDWQNVFFPITNTSVAELQPLSASAMSLTGRPYVQRQPRYYTLQQCKNRIEILVTYLGENVILQGIIDPVRPEDKHPFNLTHPGTFQISSLVGSEPFELNLVARSTAKLRRLTNNGASYGIKFFFMKKKPVYSIQAEFALLVNGEERLRHAIGNSRSDRQYRGVRIRIDPNHLVDMKILEDF